MKAITEKFYSIKNSYLSYHPHLINGIALSILVICLYVKVTWHEFLINWDDVDYIIGNQDIRGFTLQNLKNIFTKYYSGNYAPLHLLSYMIDYSIWGLNPAAFKITNVLLHSGCTLIFYRLLVRLGFTMPQAFLASVLFAVHPVQVESVAWASQRKTPLSMLFFLASWYSWDIWKSGESRNKKLWYAGSLGLFTLALLSKSVTVILPFFLLAHELILDRKPVTWRMLTSKLPYVALAGACFVMALLSQKGADGGLTTYHGGSFYMTMLNMLTVFSHYLILLLFPINLVFIYNAPIKTFPDFSTLLSGMVLLLFVIGWIRLRKPHPIHFFWLSLFIIGLLPVSNIIPIVTMMNDRYLYYPMLGIAPFIVLSLYGAIDSLRIPFFPIAIITIIIVTAFSVATWKQIDIWKNSMALWSDAISKADAGTWYSSSTNTNFLNEGYAESLVVHATTLNKESNRAAAQRYCLLALTYEPNNYNALGLLAGLYMEDNKPLLARPHVIKLVNIYKKSDIAHSVLGLNYKMTNEIKKAEEQFRIALDINPQNERADINLKDIVKIRTGSPD